MSPGECHESFGLFDIIIECSETGLTRAVYDDHDVTCEGEPTDILEYKHAEYVHEYDHDGFSTYAKYTILSEDDL